MRTQQEPVTGFDPIGRCEEGELVVLTSGRRLLLVGERCRRRPVINVTYLDADYGGVLPSDTMVLRLGG